MIDLPDGAEGGIGGYIYWKIKFSQHFLKYSVISHQFLLPTFCGMWCASNLLDAEMRRPRKTPGCWRESPNNNDNDNNSNNNNNDNNNNNNNNN